jgi:hypothetical protein
MFWSKLKIVTSIMLAGSIALSATSVVVTYHYCNMMQDVTLIRCDICRQQQTNKKIESESCCISDNHDFTNLKFDVTPCCAQVKTHISNPIIASLTQESEHLKQQQLLALSTIYIVNSSIDTNPSHFSLYSNSLDQTESPPLVASVVLRI